MFQKELNIAKNASLEAGRKIFEIYKSNKFEEASKLDNTPITRADQASQDILIDHLGDLGVPILSEEQEDDLSRIGANSLWIVDPLDGTMDFIKKTDDFSIMIGLVENGEVKLGVVCAPAKDKIYYAVKDRGAFVEDLDGSNKKELRVSENSGLVQARPVFSRFHLGKKEQMLLSAIGISDYNKMGSGGLKMSSIAAGESDFYVSFTDKMREWDTCASEIILKEAGGMVTDLDGESLQYNKEDTRQSRGILASNAALHLELIKLIKKFL